MKSKFSIDSVIDDMITHNIRTVYKDLWGWLFEDLIRFNCQDTDNDGNVECYFYFKNTINPKVLDLCTKFIGETILGIDPDSATIEDQTSEGNPEIRVEFIVSFN